MQHCTECGSPLPSYWPQGLCNQCALAGALEMTHAESQVHGEKVIDPPLAPMSSLAQTNPPPSTVFGDYVLLTEIARGGMGVVYQARQVSLDRIVAVKMILAGSLAGKEFVQRFRSEAAAAAILQHPNIVAVHDVGVQDGRHYFSMDYVDGQNLAQLVGQQPLPASKAAGYVTQIADAIHYAHQKGILHRDLKPSNVLVDRATDQPKVTDFGLAKRLDNELSLTTSGQVLGSPHFMPPEQAGARRGKVGRPSDVYALGGILYYLLTARAPFQADTLEQVITQVLHSDPVALRLLNPSIPRDLETITLKCLEKEPSRRYQTAGDLADELGRFLRREPILARPVTLPEKVWRWSQRKPLLAFLIVLLHLVGAAGLGGILWQWRRAEIHARLESQERIAGQRQLYLANLNLLQHCWEQYQGSRVRELLAQTASAPERGFEWYYWQRQMHLQHKTLRGHAGPILDLAYSPDGQRIVTASEDQTARIWDAQTGKELLRLQGHQGPVPTVALSPDGHRLVTGGWDHTARIWDAKSGDQLLSLEGHDDVIFSVAWSYDGRHIVTGGHDNTARVWDAISGTNRLVFRGHTDRVLSVAIAPDDRRIVSGSWDQTAIIWDARTGRSLLTLSGHEDAVAAVAFAPHRELVITGGYDGTARIWDAITGQCQQILTGHTKPVLAVGFSSDETRILTGSEDETARVWDSTNGRQLRVIQGHGSAIGSAAFSPDDRFIVTGGGGIQFSPDGQFIGVSTDEDHTARVWDAINNPSVLTLRGHSKAVCSVDLSPDGRLAVSGSFDGTARSWDLQAGREIQTICHQEVPIRAVALFRDGSRVVTGGFDGSVRVWQINKTGAVQLLDLIGHTAEVFSVDVTTDGQRIVTGSWDHTVRLWDATTGKQIGQFTHRSAVFPAMFSPDDGTLLSADDEGTILLWNLSDATLRARLQDTSKVWSVAFAPDGRLLVTGHHAALAKVWDLADGQPILTLKGHTRQIHAVAFSSDGQRVLTTSGDHTIKLWDALSGHESLTLRGHTQSVLTAVFSLDGLRIVTGSQDRTLKVWEAASKEQVAQWQAEENPLPHSR